MTEAEWLGSEDSRTMLEFLRWKVSDRKLRLFTADYCRRIWHLLTVPRSKTAVAVGERFAENLATTSDLEKARTNSRAACRTIAEELWWPSSYHERSAVQIAEAAVVVVEERMATSVLEIAGQVVEGVAESAGLAASEQGAYVTVRAAAVKDELGVQASLLRDIFGNPFRPITLAPRYRNATVLGLAQAISTERAFDRLPILADALEEAGCTETALLEHCRGSEPHVLGCWALDAVLGKA